MTVRTGRLGWVAVALESTPGAPVQPVDYIPYLECSLQERQGVLADVSARGTRDEQPENSQLGRRWGEGNLRVNLDATLAPYLFAMAQGSPTVDNQGSGVYKHTFSLADSNAPKAASIIFDRVQDRQLFHYAVVNSLEMSFDEGLAELNANIMSRFPVASTSGTLTTTSGVYYAFRHAVIQVGSNILNAANSADHLKVRSFNITINNNTEPQFVAGNRDADSIIQRNYNVSGSFRLAFEDNDQRDKFRNLTKQAMVVTFTGNGIGGGLSEYIKLKVYKLRVDEYNVDVPNDEFVSEEINFMAEYSSDDSATLDIEVQNRKASY